MANLFSRCKKKNEKTYQYKKLNLKPLLSLLSIGINFLLMSSADSHEQGCQKYRSENPVILVFS